MEIDFLSLFKTSDKRLLYIKMSDKSEKFEDFVIKKDANMASFYWIICGYISWPTNHQSLEQLRP